MKRLAADGAPEGTWLRADRQTSGRGRSGRSWRSPPGNLYASTLVRLKGEDPPAPTLALAAGVALHDVVRPISPTAMLKWPNDLLIGARKIAGILLERVERVVIIGVGVNLASHPEDVDRPATSLRAEGNLAPPPEVFMQDLAHAFSASLATWRSALDEILDRWLRSTHPVGTPLTTHGPAGETLSGVFAGLEPDGALRLRLADGEVRIIHAGDVFLV